MHEIGGIGTVSVGCVETGALKSSIVVAFGPSELIVEFRPNETRQSVALRVYAW